MKTRSFVLRDNLTRLTAICAIVFLAATAALADGTVTGTVTQPDGTPFPDVAILVTPSGQEATTDADGNYSLTLPAGAYNLLAVADGYDSNEESVSVVDGETSTLDFDLVESIAQFGDSVVVVGARQERTVLESTVPVDVLTPVDMEDSGQTETSRMIQFLAPSFNYSTSTVSDGTDIVRPSTLRGMGPDQTLVLVNGKRRYNSALVNVNGSIGRGTAGTDLNAIPPSAIGQIEVLRDGAAAQYGSDAIAGVINLQYKKTTDITNIELSAGQYYEGDGETLQGSINHGFKVGDGGFINGTFEYRDRGWTNRAGLDPRRIFNFLEQQPGQPALSEGTPDPREATYDRLNHRYGDAESKNLYFYLNADIPLQDDWSLYFFGGIANRDGESAGFNRLPSQGRTNILIHPEGHLPMINTTVEDNSAAVGVIKTFSDWSLDASVTWGQNDFNFDISNSANTSFGAASGTSADAGTLSIEQINLNLDLYRIADWGSTPVMMAFGGEYREDTYQIVAGVPLSFADGRVPDQFGGRSPAGIQVFPGFRPSNEVDESRDNVSLYGDLEFSIGDSFLLDVAARFEDYSDFGNKVIGKVAGRYQFTEKFALRGSVNSGFRAPSLSQSNFNNISTQFVDVDGELLPLEVGTFRVSDPVAQALGAEDLREETSIGYSIGFTSRPQNNLTITGDFYAVDIEDRIVLSGRFSASNPQIGDLLEPFGVNAAQFFTNAIDTSTTGADLVIAWSKPMSADSNLSLTAAANWNKTELDGEVRTPPELEGLGETLFNDIEVTYLERGQPRQHYNLAGRYRKGAWGTMLRFNYFGEVTSTESASDPARKQTFAGKWLTDLDLSYTFDNGIRASIGGTNIFDTFPDKNIASNSFNGIFVYPRRVAPFGFNGGYYYAKVSINL